MNTPIRLTPAVKFLVIACVAVFVVQQTTDIYLHGSFTGWFALVPHDFVFGLRLWQIVTYAFLHGDVMHLFLNLMMLVFIGSELESVWGTVRFLRYFFICSVGAGVLYLLLQTLIWRDTGLYTPMVGASGGIYGLLVAYGLLFGERVMLFMMMFPMKAKHFVWILAAIEFFSSVFSGRGGLASAAHLGGMAVGFGALWLRASIQIARKARAERQALGTSRRKRAAAKHLKLVTSSSSPGLPRTNLDDSDDGNGKGPTTWH